jgi:hypothetical protein
MKTKGSEKNIRHISKIIMHGIILLILFFNPVYPQLKNIPAKETDKHPVYLPAISDIAKLKELVEPVTKIPLKELIALVPEASGINYVGCPDCHGGAQENGVLVWEYGMGDKVKCKYCSMVFPNEKYHNNREKVIIAPSGIRQVYSWYEDPEGRQYFFEAHAWYERWSWIQSMAENLARVWYITKDNKYGDRAAAIAGRFAQVFPDYAIRYDYPNAPVKFFPADQKWPYEGLTPYRGAKWNWWGYNDIPDRMMNVYDILMSGYDWKRMNEIIGPETGARIASDLLRLGYEFTAANPEVYSNMSPGMYSDMIRVGRILKDPTIVHEGVKRFREFFSTGFFADGWWKEGTSSYHDQTIGGLRTVAEAFKGYTYPSGWKGERLENLDLTKELPLFYKALQVSREAVLPDGRKIPINDTWAGRRRGQKSDNTVSRLWPSLGNAALGTGSGDDQIMLNINWSGNYGHSHYDNGSIILFASGEEMLSDIGYTHTKYRGWTIHTASHNTVVIDQKNQDAGTKEKPATGRLMHYDDSDPHVKTIDVDASPAYSVAKEYRRLLIMVHAGPGYDYIADLFEVEGGQDHDWFLHGMCEQEGVLTTSITLDQPVESLVPAWGGKNKPGTQYDTDQKRFHAYIYLGDIKTGEVPGLWTATWKYEGAGLRTHIFPPEGARVFRFRSPSIRRAGEDENKLDEYYHSGIMQRHSGGATTFKAVHEPFRKDPWIRSVSMNGNTLTVSYTMDGTPVEDKVTLTEGEVTVTSSAGWTYNMGKALSGKVEALETGGGKWQLLLDRKMPDVKYIRLDIPDGGTRYYKVAEVSGKRIRLSDDPGFTMETGTGRIKFHTFPGDQYTGPLRYTVLIK